MELADLILDAEAELDRARAEAVAARQAREELVRSGAPAAELDEAAALVAAEELEERQLAGIVRALATKREGSVSAPALSTETRSFAEFERVADALEDQAAVDELSMLEIEAELENWRTARRVREAQASMALLRLKERMKTR